MNLLHRLWGNGASFGTAMEGRRNNFDALRLIAALAVLFGHSFVLAAGEQSPATVDPISRWLIPASGFGEAIHEFAVDIFFVISGFLIARSFLTRPTLLGFVESRILRIFPAAILCSILTVVLLAGISRLPAGDYFTDPQTLDYLLRNSLLWSVEYHLPGVFAGNPYGSAVNGSLWTLPVELRCYIFLFVVGVLRILRRPLTANLLILVLAVLFLVPEWSSLVTRNPDKWRLFLFFFAGAACYVNRDRIPLGILPAFLLLALYIASAPLPGLHALLFVALVSYLTLALALGRYVRRIDPGRIGDLSYGTYLYAFPVQQSLLYATAGALTGWQLAGLAAVATLAFAALSWFAVERYALSLKGRVSRKLGAVRA